MLHQTLDRPALDALIRSIPLDDCHKAINLIAARMQHRAEYMLNADLTDACYDHVQALDDHAGALAKALDQRLWDAGKREVFS